MDESIVIALMSFLYKRNLKAGESVEDYRFQNEFVKKLRRDQQDYAWNAVDALVERGVLERAGLVYSQRTFDIYKLTKKGVDALRANAGVQKTNSTINNIHISGQSHVQIGDKNVQHNKSSWDWKKIDEVLEDQNASDEQKAEAKSFLLKIAENPFLSSFLTAIGGEAIKRFLT